MTQLTKEQIDSVAQWLLNFKNIELSGEFLAKGFVKDFTPDESWTKEIEQAAMDRFSANIAALNPFAPSMTKEECQEWTKEYFFKILQKPKENCDGVELHLRHLFENNNSKSIFLITGIDFREILKGKDTSGIQLSIDADVLDYKLKAAGFSGLK